MPNELDTATIEGYAGSPSADMPTPGIGSTLAAKNLFASWRINPGVPQQGEAIDRIQVVVNSNAELNQSNFARIIFGRDYFASNGQGEQGCTSNASSNPRSPRTQNLPHRVRLSSAATSLPGGFDQQASNFDLIDEPQSFGGHFFSVSSVIIDTIPRECLGSGGVPRNKGVATVSNEDGHAVGLVNDAGTTVAVDSSVFSPSLAR